MIRVGVVWVRVMMVELMALKRQKENKNGKGKGVGRMFFIEVSCSK